MATEANSALNLRTAARNVVASLGVPSDPKERSYAQQAAYLKALAAEVLRYPNSFTQATLDNAARIAAKNYGALDSTDFAWGDFASETARNAVPVLSDFTNKLLAILALAAVAYFAVLAFRTNPRRA